jgi:hypothetical protein
MTATMRFAPPEPQSGADILGALRGLHSEADAYLRTLSASTFVEPQGEKWSPADHVRHLRKSISPLVPALAMPRFVILGMFGWSRRGSHSYPALREIYLRALDDGGQAGRFAPSPRPLPADAEHYRDEILAEWQRTSDELLVEIARWPETSLDRCRLPHPLLGKLSVREMLFFTLYHNSHHLNLIAARV